MKCFVKEEMIMDQKRNDIYFMGLDMGTSSVGWAVTDEHYNLIRRKEKDLWGARLFEEAHTAQDRRMARTNRRRNQRKKQRIAFVKEKFRKEIEKVDPNFFKRLDESQLYLEDKTIKAPYLLFNDRNFTDQDFYRQYPTVFHLRSDMLNSDKKFDIREIYIACSSLFEHRGNFLNKALGNNFLSVDQLFDDLIEVSALCDIVWNFDHETLNEVKKILSDRNYKKTEKLDKLKLCVRIDKRKEKNKIYRLS